MFKNINIKRSHAVLRIVAIYALFGCLWIYVSGNVLEMFSHDTTIITRFEIAKGFVFVLVTASLLYLLLYRYTRQLAASEQSLRESEERYRTVVEDQTEIICRIKENGTFIFVNDVFCRFFEKTRDELLGSTWGSYTIPDDVPIVEEQLRRLSSSNPVVSIENRVYSGSGEVRWMQFVSRGFFDKEGRLIESQSVGRDITDRKEAEHARRTSDERLNLAMAATKMGVWEWNVQTNALIWTPECFEILGAESLNGTLKSFINVLHPDDADRVMAAANQALAEKMAYSVEYRIIRSNGDVRWLSNLAQPNYDEKGSPLRLIGTVHDITERKRAEEALRQTKEAAEEALRQAKEAAEATARIKSQFLTNMSHELRTPMTGILGMLQLALANDLGPVTRGYLETTLSSASSLLEILNDILDMAKIEAGKLNIGEKPFSPQRCVTEAVGIFIPEMRRKGLDLVISVAEEIPDTVDGDQARLRQVLLNLISNAVKFTEGGKVEVRVTAGRTTSDGKRELTFAVTDTGIGIPDDKKKLLFQVFSQVDASHSRSFGGTGLGLAISSEIVELMGGTLTFETEEGVGSTFAFTIPLRETKLESGVLTTSKPFTPEAVTVHEGEKIPRLLIAEDDPTIRQVLGTMLKLATNYNYDFAEDGLKAIEMWGKGVYDLILMDIQMPLCDGFEATRAIREKEREHGGHTPIVAVTAHARKEDEENCLAAGMDGYMSKPIDFNKCIQLIGEIIKQKLNDVN